MPDPRPLVIAVGGIPGSGKTTLSRRLGDVLHLPVVCRDAIKEGMHVTHGSDDPAEVRRFSAAAFTTFWATVGALVDAGSSVVAEAAFHREFAADEFTELSARADLILVWCDLDPEIATNRYLARAERGERHPAHADSTLVPAMRAPGFDWSTYAPPDGPWPVHSVDTTAAPKLDALLECLSAAR